MANPFPGMDPYLEHPVSWTEVHQALITFTWMTLNSSLPPRYAANMGERLYVVESQRSIYPDALVTKRSSPRQAASSPGKPAGGVMTSDAPWLVEAEPLQVREVFIEIAMMANSDQVVAVIEVLSPANKAPGSEGRELYLKKQRELLKSQTHLIEIDLLRRGKHTVAAPLRGLRKKGRWDYLVSLHRGGRGNRFEVWAVSLSQRLPRIHLPLADGDPDLVLDLQDVFERCYDAGNYARRLDYHKAPTPPLKGDAATWADALLRENGLR
jgi:Protein of unknown function (DUF4058)